MPIIKPITDLRNTNEISEICHKQQQPVFITKNGYGDSADRADFPDAGAEADKPFLTLFIRLC